jgi:ADP-heptose:LPS heptosyltransferase
MKAGGEILIIHTGRLTDVVGALPAMKALRSANRGARIVLLARTQIAALGSDAPYIDAVIEAESLQDQKEVARLAQRIKAEKFDIVFDLERSEGSERLFAAMKPFPPAWVGAGRGMKFRFEAPAGMPTPEALSKQLAVAGIAMDPAERPDARWATTARRNSPSLKPEYFGLTRPYVLLAPASPGEPSAPPRWPTARFAGLAARLAANNVSVGVVCDPGDRVPVRAVCQAAPDARDIASRADLTQIASLAAEAGGVLGHADAGVTHLMAAAGAPTIAIARSHQEGQVIGPRAPSVITLAAADPTKTTVQYAAQLISMFAKVGSLSRRAKNEDDDPGPEAPLAGDQPSESDHV